MTKVYLHCSSAEEVLVGRRSAMVGDPVEALSLAATFVRSLAKAQSGKDWRGWVLQVSDDLGNELFVVPFVFMLGKPH